MIAVAKRSRVNASIGSSARILCHSGKETGSSHAALTSPVFVVIGSVPRKVFRGPPDGCKEFMASE